MKNTEINSANNPGLRAKWSQRFFEKELKNNVHKQKPVSLTKAKTALVFYPAGSKKSDYQKFISWLKQHQIRVSEIPFTLKKPEGKEKTIPDGALLHAKHFSFFGKPKPEVFSILGSQSFDYIFDLFEQSPVQLKRTMVQLQAGMKCGLFAEDHQHLDFMIQARKGNDLQVTLASLQEYLLNLKLD